MKNSTKKTNKKNVLFFEAGFFYIPPRCEPRGRVGLRTTDWNVCALMVGGLLQALGFHDSCQPGAYGTHAGIRGA